MPVKHIETMAEFEALMETSKTKLVIVDFTATWCGPCKFIGPIFEKLSESNPDIEFVKVDVDESEDVAARCGISAMPTFQFYKDGAKVDELRGANAAQLEQLISKHK